MERDYDDAEIYHYKTNFNSHAHVERDRNSNHQGRRLRHFNSHAHVERDLRITLFMHILFNFNSHAHVERDELFGGYENENEGFQLTRSRGA